MGKAIEQLVARAAEKNAAFMRGDMQRWLELARIAPDFTLMQPFGGTASRGFDASPARLAEMARCFRNGDTRRERDERHLVALGYSVHRRRCVRFDEGVL